MKKRTATPNYKIDSHGNPVPAGKPVPALAARIMREHDWTEAYLRQYVLDQLRFFADIDKRGRPTSEGYWIAFKLGMERELDGMALVAWAKGE
jgi:hypothetical protein